MKTPRGSLAFGSILLAVSLPLTALRAGDETATKPSSLAPSAQMNEYLQAQKIMHHVETTGEDTKGSPEVVTVKVYGVADNAQQESICTALAAAAKKSHVHETNVQFYTMTPAQGQPTFQASRLPGGNGEVEFPRDAAMVSNYHLQRSVKL